MSYMTKLEGVPDTDQVKPGMAFFEGTGPEGQTCGNCKHRGYARFRAPKWSEDAKDFVEKSYRVTSCAMFKALSGEHGSPGARSRRTGTPASISRQSRNDIRDVLSRR